MTLEEHERACACRFGQPHTEVHVFLDHYYREFRGNNHRLLLHHKKGVDLVVERFGEAARGPAEQHVLLDYGFVPESWEELENRFFPTSLEEEAAVAAELQKLYGEDAVI